MEKYNHINIEKKWNARWLEKPINKPCKDKEKFYCLDMFPYPSGSGIHVGHWRGYTLSDVISRYQILKNKYVIHPMGWDAFGLPAENYAIKMGVHPSITTQQNIENFKKQLQQISAVYDWDMEVNTTDENYYKWTQWIFVQMFKKGLAYEKEMPINWCPSCKTGLANEEVVNGKCERCSSDVTKKNLKQWMLKITAYADRLLKDLDELEWPQKVKKMQSEWIGKSEGAKVDFKVDSTDETITVYTTRPDTLYGASFIVLAPESDIVSRLTTQECKDEVDEYVYKTSLKKSVDRLQDKVKTGAFTGSYAINPLTNEKLPIWIADYVLADYGTGAIMCVPAHDERDFEFAKKFNLPIKQVISKDGKESVLNEAYTEDGILINSGEFSGLSTHESKTRIIAKLESLSIGVGTTNFKLRDWVFSRQRYWGEPIPVIHCEKCGVVAVDEKDLPVRLPDVEKYEPTGTGESPLADIEEWVNTTCPCCGNDAKRETNTMPQWAGSSWYFLRYVDNKNDDELISKEKANKFLPVDLYVGGVEHAVLHLLYARFYTKFLYDIGVVNFEEPFKRLFNQGMIIKDGFKMSKSKGNVVSPDELIENYGCDSLRMYELFVGPAELDAEWNDNGIDGVYRFINKFYRMFTENEISTQDSSKIEYLVNNMINDITKRIDDYSMNTAISGFMEYTNKIMEALKDGESISKNSFEKMAILIAPFAPHIAEELWEFLGNKYSVFESTWPCSDKSKMIANTMKIAVQVNGKTRAVIEVDVNMQKEDVIKFAKKEVQSRLTGDIIKEIYVPKKIVNIVIK